MRQGGSYTNDGKGNKNSIKLVHQTKPAEKKTPGKPSPSNKQSVANTAEVSDGTEN